MSEKPTTSNGCEITHPVAKIDAEGFKRVLSDEFGIDAQTPSERIEQLKCLSVEGIAILLERINKSIQGAEDSLISHDKVIKIGGEDTIRIEDRYDVFLKLVEVIKSCPKDVNPARVGDMLALGVVLLHPFKDGNGRTARVLGLMFRDNYDGQDYTEDFSIVTEPRDEARERGGFIIYGYIANLPAGFKRSNPDDVITYLSSLLKEDNDGLYLSCYGQAQLTS